MHRSYFHIQFNDLQVFENDKLYQADAIIIHISDALKVFSPTANNQTFSNKVKALNIPVYLELDLTALKSNLRTLVKQTINDFSGFYLDNPTISQIKKLSLFCRAYEVKHKLAYQSLSFIVAINQGYEKNDKIIKASRVHKLIVEPFHGENQAAINDLIKTYHKTFVSSKQITNDLEAISDVNKEYTLTQNQINQSLTIINNFNYGTKSERRAMLKKADLTYHYQVLTMAKKLGLIADFPQLNLVVVKKKIKLSKKPIAIKKFYTLGEEIGNAISHGVGVALAIVAIICFLIKGGSTIEMVSYLTFGASALVLYLMSTLYHAFTLGKKPKRLFQKFDHMTIYILIAGTYTPFSLLAIGGKTGLYLCLGLWSGALIGILLNLFAFGKFRFFHMFLYVALGWVAIFFLPQITSNLASGGVWLLIIGGVMYTLGIFFYALRLFKFSHMIWHIFTILGTVAHFLAILFYL